MSRRRKPVLSQDSATLAPRCDTSVLADFVLVHGAGTGGWLWDDVATQLRAAGHRVYAPSLRGVGARSADDGADIRLSDHIDEVVGLVLEERLDTAAASIRSAPTPNRSRPGRRRPA